MKKLAIIALLAFAPLTHAVESIEQSYRRMAVEHEIKLQQEQQGDYYTKINLCSQEGVKARLISTFNSVPEFQNGRGELVDVKNIKTDHVSMMNGVPFMVSCMGDFKFSSGVKEYQGYGFQF